MIRPIHGRAWIVAALCAWASTAQSAVVYNSSLDNLQTTGQVLVKYKEGRGAAARAALAKQTGATRARSMQRLGVDVVNVPKNQSMEALLQSLARNPDVEWVEPNGIFRALAAPDDTQYSSQFYLGSGYINVETAWDITHGSSDVVVAVIDTGITPTHSDLTANLWSNPNVSGTSGAYGTQLEIDWNSDGDCTDTAACSDISVGPDQCASATPIDNNDYQSVYHGTRVSGFIAAVTNNTNGIAGVARNSKIMTIKALNRCGVGPYDVVAEAIIYAVDNNASVINMSLGGSSTSQAVTDAVAYAIANNVVVVAAAGNAGNSASVDFPASISSVIAVGATDSSNVLTNFSQTGSALDLVAPGQNMLSTFPPNTYDTGSGTSFAAPLVAGVAALLRGLDPDMSVEDVTRYINFSARDLGQAGYDTSYGFGLLNAGAALSYAATGTPPPPSASPTKTYPIPNPFRPLVNGHVELILPTNLMNAASKEIKIFTITGERVRTLTNSTSWDGRNEEGNTVASGLYHYYVDTSLGTTKGKVTVLK